MNGYVKNKCIYGLVWIAVIAMIVWIIAGTGGDDVSEDITVNQQPGTVEATESDMIQENKEEAYYLVKAEGEKVNVYWVDESGEHLHLETTVTFGLLSSEDQKLLQNGVRLKSDEELFGFLENYDS